MNINNMSDETICAYCLFLRVGLVEFSEYRAWLDNAFLEDVENQNELLIELEYATNNVDSTIHILDQYLSDKMSSIDFDLLGKMVTAHIKGVYMNCAYSIEELLRKIYGLWNDLPPDIAERQPFHMMSYIDDPLSYGDRAQAIDLLEQFIDFYDQ